MKIEHITASNEFVVYKEDQQGRLSYRLIGDNRVEFLSTYIPFRLRGKGLAEQLVLKGLQWAKDNGYEVSSRCWYVDKFLTD